MATFESADALLDFAIAGEEEAVEFYTKLAEKAQGAARKAFEDFAKEEMGHKQKLLAIKAGRQLAPVEGRITDLKIADYVVDVDEEGELDYRQALLIAMKKEKAAFKLYTALGEAARDEGLRSLLLALAQEEAKHKLRFEIEYDENVLSEN
ncbi:MAG TPA: ferritin family protein [Thermoguttaceae bacterium]|nr:ferritin family protein [Thermoguttaceae bacterium]